MPDDLKGYRVFIASPGGLDDVRKAFCEVLEERNKCEGLLRKSYFIPIGWEETIGGAGSPQDTLNDEVRNCDYFIMVLWDRWGSPSRKDGDKKYSSGTEEEYHIALECLNSDITKFPMRQIVIFFKFVDERRLSDPGEQLQKVLDFRKKLELEKTHLFHIFDTVDSFSRCLRKYLAKWTYDDESGNTAKIKNPVAPYDEDAAKAREMSKLETPAKLPKSLEEDIKKLVKKADKLANEGKIIEAETAYSEAVVQSNAPAAINAYGLFLYRLGRLDQAEVMYKRVIEIAQSIKDEELKSIALGNLGIVYQMRGDLNKAEEMFKKALAIDEKLGRLEGMANQFGNLGLIYQTHGDLEKAEEMLKKSLAISEKLGKLEGMASDYGNLGIIYRTRGDLDKAEEMHKKSLQIEEKLGRPEGMANQYCNLGLIYQMRGELDKAEEMHKKALAIDEKLGRLEGMARGYGNLGLIYDTRGDLDKAEEMHKKALEIDERVGNQEGMARHYGNLSTIYQTHGDLDKAEKMNKKSLQIEEKLGRLEGMASDYGNLGLIYQKRGDLKKAKEYWVKARDLFAKIGMPEAKQVQEWIDSAKPN